MMWNIHTTCHALALDKTWIHSSFIFSLACLIFCKFNKIPHIIKQTCILNNQFKSVSTQEKGGPTPTLAGPHYPSISPLHIFTECVKKLLSDLKTDKASGPDDISACILKELANELAPLVSAFFTQLINPAVYHQTELWHMCCLSTRKGAVYSLRIKDRYLWPLYCVRWWSTLYANTLICKHTDEHNILTLFRHWFRQARSCKTQQLTTLYDLLAYWNKNSQVDVIVLDFRKVFDSSPRQAAWQKSVLWYRQ